MLTYLDQICKFLLYGFLIKTRVFYYLSSEVSNFLPSKSSVTTSDAVKSLPSRLLEKLFVLSFVNSNNKIFHLNPHKLYVVSGGHMVKTQK